jgi:hypothetical protein
VLGKFPFNKPSPVDPKDEAAKEIRFCLKNGISPGPLFEGNDFKGLSQLLERCWFRGDMRPTATDVTRIMQAMYIQQSLANSIAAAPDHQLYKDKHLRDDLMRNIQKARALNPPGTRKSLEITSDLRISSADFTIFYQEDDDWDSIKSYLVGAAIFWGLADLPILGIYSATEASTITDLEMLKGKSLCRIDYAYSEDL